MSGTGSNNSGGWRFEPTAQTKKQEKFLLDRFFVLIVGKLIFAAGIILVIATQANGNLIGHKVNMGAFVFGIILFVIGIGINFYWYFNRIRGNDVPAFTDIIASCTSRKGPPLIDGPNSTAKGQQNVL
jgi:hypothetical protein